MTATDSYFPDEYEFTDDVLGRVHLNQLERDCVDTPEYRRLFRVSQLGLVDRLYHTANHTRGIHSIGVCYHAKQLVDHLNSNTPRVAAARGRRRDLPTSTLPTITHAERCLISLAGLLHDLPHGPLSHDIEKKTHRYGDGNDTRLRSCYGPYPKHDDCENNPALYVILFDTQRSVLARVLEHHSPNFWQQLRADALMHEHLKSFVDLVPKCHWKGYERALLPTLLFHLLLFEDIDTAKSHTQLMVMKDFEDKPQYWGLGPKDHWAPLHKAWYQPYRHDIVGNTLSADLLDYLARDAKRLGIRTPFDVKLLEYYVLVKEGVTGTSPSPATDLARCAIDLNDYKRGVIRSERINDVFRLLDFRHEIHEKAIYHRIVQSAIAMLGRALMLAGTGKPTLAQLYAIGEPHHAATGDDQFLRDLATHTPDGHAARRYHSIGQKILERRLYRPLMMIPGDEVYNLLPPSYQRYSQDNNEKCLRLLGAILDSTYFKPFFCFICWCVERLLDHSFATTEELDEFVEKRARSEGTLDWVRSVVPGRVILWSTPYKQLYKDPALVVRAYEHVGQIDALASHDHANHTQLPPTLLSRLRVGMEDAEARYAAMWRIYVFISDGLYYSGGLARLIEHHPCRDEERHHLEHLGHLEQAQDEILRAIKVAAEWWTEHQESDLSDRIAEGDLKELLILFLTHSTARDVEKVPSHAKDRRRACGVNLEQYAHVEPDSGCKDVRYRFDRPADLLGAVEDAGLGKEVEVAVREFFRAAKLNTGKIGHEELVDLICHIGPYIDQLADTGDLEHAARIGSKAYDDVSLREVWRKSEELTATNGEEDVATAHAAVSRTVAREKPVSNRGKKSTGREGPRRQQSSSDAAKLQFSDATGPASPSGGRVSDQQETETK